MVDEGGATTSPITTTIDQPILVEKQSLSPCHVCGRTFLPASLKKHEKICEKNATKKRKVFDSLKQRVEGTDLAAFHQKSYLRRPSIEPAQVEYNRIKRQSQWKEKHLELVNAIRAAKGQNTNQMSTPVRKTAPVMAANERCPSCDRQFGPKAYDRHVEWCKERKARIHHSPANVLLAKERLEARIRYRVPPIKSKRQANKEKYSGGGTSPTEMTASLTSTSKVGSFSRGPSIRRPKMATESGTSTSTSTSSQINKAPEKKEKSPVRIKEKSPVRMVPKSPVLERVQSKTTSTPTQSSKPRTYDPFESAQRQFEQLLESDDFQPVTSINLNVKHRPQTATIKEPKLPQKLIEKRGSVIDPPTYFKDSFDSITDDFEMLENMINSNLIDDKNISIDSFFLNLQQPDVKNRKLSDDVSLIIDPCLINENDNLSLPDHFKVDNSYSPISTGESDITIRNESDVYSEQCDRNIEEEFAKMSPISGDVVNKTRVNSSKSNYAHNDFFNKYESNLKDSIIVNNNDTKIDFKMIDNKTYDKKVDNRKKVIEKKKVSNKKDAKSNKKLTSSTGSQNVPENNAGRGDYDKKKPLKRQNTLFDVAPKKPPSLKSKADVESYFSGDKAAKSNANRNRKSPDLHDTQKEEMETILKPEDLFAVDDEMYEEYKKYEEMYLREKQQKAKSKKQKPKLIEVNYGLLTASEEDDVAQLNKLSNDSAYGSLTRKTPKRNRNAKLSPLEQKNPDSTSSSGSEHNPTANTAKQDLNAHQEQQRLSKFCHECGQKYPLNSAKFCVECGVRRLVL